MGLAKLKKEAKGREPTWTQIMSGLKLDVQSLQKDKKLEPEPAFREIANGLYKEVREIFEKKARDLIASCCFEGCCVSFCCVRINHGKEMILDYINVLKGEPPTDPSAKTTLKWSLEKEAAGR